MENSVKYLIKLSYVGTSYSGLQRQTKNENTIQEILESYIVSLTKSTIVKTQLLSRTDSGVHAKEQFICIVLNRRIKPLKIIPKLNNSLPNDIRVHSFKNVSDDFNIQKMFNGKIYRYYFSLKQMDALSSINCLYLPFDIDVKKVKEALDLFSGEHNFSGYCIQGSRSPNTVRTVESIHLKRSQGKYFVEIKGSGFLKYMVRFIMGSIFLYAKGDLDLIDLQSSLRTGIPLKKSYKAPAQGLTLHKFY